MTEGFKEKITEALVLYGFQYDDVHNLLFVIEDVVKLSKEDMEENEPRALNVIQECEVAIKTLSRLNFQLD